MELLSQPIVMRPNGKDSRWLTLEVCREHARGKCPRSDEECKYAHPPPHVEVSNGRVTCCFDSVKGKCQRTDPPCKYLHPPQHLKELLLQNGRQNLILKNYQAALSGLTHVVPVPNMYTPVMYDSLATKAAAPTATPQYRAVVIPGPGQYPVMYQQHPYIIPGGQQYQYISPVMGTGAAQSIMPTIQPCGTVPVSMAMAHMSNQMASVVPASLSNGVTQQAVQQTAAENTAGSHLTTSQASVVHDQTASWEESTSPAAAIPTMSYASQQLYQPPQLVEVLTSVGRKRTHDSVDDVILGVNSPAGLVPVVKRPALVDAKGMPVYRPLPTSLGYQQMALAVQLQQQQPSLVPMSVSGLPSVLPRY